MRACGECELCKLGDDQYCKRCVFTYNGKDWGEGDAPTYGGYSNRIVLDHRCGGKSFTTISLCAVDRGCMPHMEGLWKTGLHRYPCCQCAASCCLHHVSLTNPGLAVDTRTPPSKGSHVMADVLGAGL